MKAKEIERVVSRITNVSIDMMHTKRGNRVACEARSITWYLRKKYLGHSFNKMGKEFGHKNHCAVRKGVLNLKDHIETEKELKNTIDLLEKMVVNRLDKITIDKRRYNDHYLLKQNCVKVNAKLKLVSLDEQTYEDLGKSSKNMVSRLGKIGYGIQWELGI